MSSLINNKMFRLLTMTTLQDRIRQALEVAGIKPIELAKRARVSRATVSLWVNGPTQKLEGENLTRAAAALGVDAHWLATGDGNIKSGVSESRASYGSEDERRLINEYRALGYDDKRRILAIMNALTDLAASKRQDTPPQGR
jgi:transcriptional regulator with XRE-family HTH domain